MQDDSRSLSPHATVRGWLFLKPGTHLQPVVKSRVIVEHLPLFMFSLAHECVAPSRAKDLIHLVFVLSGNTPTIRLDSVVDGKHKIQTLHTLKLCASPSPSETSGLARNTSR